MKISIISLLLCLVLFSCREKKEKSNQVKIGISIGPDQERWKKDRDYLVQYLEKQNAEVFVEEAESNPQNQAKQVRKLIEDNQINVLIIVPVNSETAGKIVDFAKGKEVDVVAYDRIVHNCDLDFYVSFDNVRVGEIQAEYLTRIKPEGKYVLLGGDANDHNSTLLKIGQMNVLQPYVVKGDIEIVLEENVTNWNVNDAYSIIDEFLKNHKAIDAIIASSDALSEGAARAIADHNLTGQILLSGQDAETGACRRIVREQQTMTVYKVIESLASSAANIAMALAENKEIPNSQMTISNGEKMVPSLLLSSVMPVGKENLRMTVIADGYIDEDAVFNSVGNDMANN